MLHDLFVTIAPLVIVVVLAMLYGLAIEKRLEREMEEAENLRQGFEKIRWDGLPLPVPEEP